MRRTPTKPRSSLRFDHRLHELATNAPILHFGIHGDRANAGDGATLIEAIASNNLPVAFGHNAIESPDS